MTPMPWVDELICARIPDAEMLRTFKFVGSVGEFRALLGVLDEDGRLNPRYAYLDGLADDAEVLHPDVVADFGYATEEELLARLTELVSGPASRTADDHWSLHLRSPTWRQIGAQAPRRA